MEIINNQSASTTIGGISGKIAYNGKTINVPYGSSFEMTDGKVLIDGKPIEEYNQADRPIIKIEITGSVNTLSTASADVTVDGDVGSVRTMSGDVHCNTIQGSVHTMSGDVTCAQIEGDCSTMSGSIRR